MHIHARFLMSAFLVLGCVSPQAAHSQDLQPTGVIIENVRIFDGISDLSSTCSLKRYNKSAM